MKTKKSIRNFLMTFFSNFITILIGFIAQAIFIKTLGEEYLGINSLFTNIISMLGIVELGIGSAIIYNLYKPIADKDFITIKSLMAFYKKSYTLIALIILLLGILITPFLSFFVDTSLNININLIYLFFIVDVFFSYLFTYKRSIFYATQENYIINIIHIIYLIILNTIQITLLINTKNYYLYLGIKIAMRLIENIFISKLADKKYPYLKDKDIKALDKSITDDILKKVKALFIHKIGAFIISGTDNIIISKFLGIVQVGLYSNYYLIIYYVQNLFGQAITSITASVGHLLVTESSDKCFDIFKKVRFLNFWIATFSSAAILIIMKDFITLWIGSRFVLPFLVLIVLVINYFQTSMRSSYGIFKEAAGIFHEDRFIPIIESLINIVFSIVLLKYFGLAGVFMGTILSSFMLWGYSYPKFVYKRLFKRSYTNYLRETLGYLVLFVIVLISTYYLSNVVIMNDLFFTLIIKVLIALIIPNLILVVIFYNSDNFKYYKKLIFRKK